MFTQVSPKTKAIIGYVFVAAAVAAAALFQTSLFWAASLVITLASGIGTVRLVARQDKRMLYLEGSLDAVQLPITVTDLDMQWIFINKVTESLLAVHGLDKKSCLGKHCSNWQADICGTDKCGIASLRKGVPRTHYHQQYPDKPSTYMQVDTSYIRDRGGKPIGHIEIVTDIDAQHRLQNLIQSVAASMEESSASLEEMSSVTKKTAETADSADRLMGEANTTVDHVSDTMNELTRSMDEITQASEETSKIVKTIDEIAFQTNLLALNAAVEAARAGEAGAGFAVVADEVRNLALRAAEAAGNTSELIEGTVKKINAGHGQVQASNQSFKGLSDTINHSSELFSSIASSAREQSLGIEQITQAVAQIEQMLLENSGGAESQSPRSRGVSGAYTARTPLSIEAGTYKDPSAVLPLDDD